MKKILIIILCVISLTACNRTKTCETNTTETKETIVVAPSSVYSVTTDEREMLARLVYLEGNTTSFECQTYIVSVVFNQLATGYLGNTLYDVVYYKNNYSPAYLIDTTTPTQTNYDVVDYIIKNGSVLPDRVRYFRADHDHTWGNYTGYINIDNVYFGYFTNDKIR